MDKKKVKQKITEIEDEFSLQEIFYLFDILADFIPLSQLQVQCKKRVDSKMEINRYVVKEGYLMFANRFVAEKGFARPMIYDTKKEDYLSPEEVCRLLNKKEVEQG